VDKENGMGWAVVGTVLGALIGALASLAGQQVTARAADKREALVRHTALRLERKGAIDAFFEIAQEAERVAGDRKKYNDDILSKVHSALWMHYKRLALICSPALISPLDDLAHTLSRDMWGGAPDGLAVWQHLQEPSRRFREAARTEIERYGVG
jgi:hypothetical protein